MCQLFGLNSARPVSPHFSLRGFFRRGGGTDHHGYGWGLAYFNNHNSILQVRDTPAHHCKDADAILQRNFKASTVIAHVRKATEGKVCLKNSHPFVRRLWGRDWVFAHNGELTNFFPELDFRFLPSGETDSERAFCHILSKLSAHFGFLAPELDPLLEYLATLSSEIAQHGTFNFLMSDGRMLLAHASTQLFWTERMPPFGAAELIDEENRTIDFMEHNDPGDRVIVLATRPLTRKEPWYPMARGELKAFVGGQEYSSLLPAKPVRHSLETLDNKTSLQWCTGWDLKLNEIF